MLGDNYSGTIAGAPLTRYYGHDTVNGSTIADVHRKALYEIIWNRRNIMSVTEDGEKVLECGPRTYVVSDIINDRFWSLLPFSKKFLDEYTDKFLNGYSKKNTFEYDYHQRLYQYPWVSGWGDIEEYNQIKAIIDKMIKNLNTRRAVAVTWVPEDDNERKDVPCLQYIQFVVTNNTMHMNVTFRSNDMLSAFGNNAYALTTLHKYVCDYVSRSVNKRIKYGYYNHTSICPHIYYERDAAECAKVVDYFHSINLI